MRALVILTAILAVSATPALAQHEGHPTPPVDPAPTPTPAGTGGATPEETDDDVGDEPAPPVPTDFAADGIFDPAVMSLARKQLHMEHGGGVISKVMVNLGEYQIRDGENGYRWEGEAWIGGDINRLVLKSEGEGGVGSGVETAEVQVLFSRAVSPYFDLQAGLRQDLQSGPRRTYATVGFEGLAPYWFETSGALFLSSKGELLGRLEGTHDLRLTQRWILQPRAEVNLAARDVAALGIGSGVSSVELGLRLRYEIRRGFAPYIGVSFERKLGATADLARSLGEDDTVRGLVLGVRGWF